MLKERGNGMTIKVLTVKELKNILKDCSDDTEIAVYDTNSGSRLYLRVKDVDTGIRGVIDFNIY